MKIIISILFVLMFISGHSQIPEIQWQNCYGTSDTDRSYGIESLNNGYLIAVEVIDDEGLTNYHGSHDIWIINTDSTGSIIWEKCYGGSSAEAPQKVLKKSNNEFFIFGYSGSTDGDIQSDNYGFADLWVININGQGDLLWEKCYGSPGTDEPRDIILTPDGGFIMLARISSSGGDISQYFGLYDVWMCKCDSLGNIEWEKTLGNTGLDNGVSMMINSQNNIVMIGAAQRHGGMVECYPDESWGDVWLVELDLSGEILWQRCYGGSDYEFGVEIQEHNNGYLFIAKSYSNDGDVSGHHGPIGSDAKGDFWVVKINSSGEIIWENSYGGYDSDSPKTVTQTEDGGMLAIGTTYSNDGDVSGNHSFPGTYADIWAVKLSPDGEMEWQQCYGGWGMERLYNPFTILKKGDYNYIIASSTNHKSWNDDIQCDIHANGDYDAWIFELDLDDTTGLYDSPAGQDQVSVYPNPAKEWTAFNYTLPDNSTKGVIKIVDITGAVIEVIEVSGSEGQHVWDTRNIKSGVYMYSFIVNGIVNTDKVIIQK